MPWHDPEIAGYVPVPGGRIWYRANGMGHRLMAPLIAIGGGPGVSHHYMLPLLALADERPVIFYDQLDTGNADRPNDPKHWTIPRFVDEVSALREALDLDEVVLFGHSWGSIVALEWGLVEGAALKALVLASPAISTSRWRRDAEELVATLPEDMQQTIADSVANISFDSPEFRLVNEEFERRYLCREDPPPEYVLKSLAMSNTPLFEAMWGPSDFILTGSLRSYEGADRLSEITAPTLITCGQHDEARPKTCHEYAAMMPSASVVVIDDASHFTFAEQPEIYVVALRDFLDGL